MINEERYPLNGTFELTGRCNLSCKMCLVRIGQQQICESGMRERTAGEWIDMAEQVRDAGTFFFTVNRWRSYASARFL